MKFIGVSNKPISALKPSNSVWNDKMESKTFTSDLRNTNSDESCNSAILASQIGSSTKRINERNCVSEKEKFAVFEDTLFDMMKELERLKTEVNKNDL